MKREDIEKVADEFANKEYEISDIDRIPVQRILSRCRMAVKAISVDKR